jgi:hypothetical protein
VIKFRIDSRTIKKGALKLKLLYSSTSCKFYYICITFSDVVKCEKPFKMFEKF